mgnify:CR=1 FL=1
MIEQYLFWIIVVILLILWIYYHFGESSKCPSCKKWYAKQHLTTEPIREEVGYKVFTEKSQIKNETGEVIGTTEHSEQRKVKTVHYLHCYQCKKCGYQWTFESQEDHYDFYE